MRSRLIALMILVCIVGLSVGCTFGYHEWTMGKSIRRGMIAGEQLRMIQQDIDFFFDIDEYSTSGRWTK